MSAVRVSIPSPDSRVYTRPTLAREGPVDHDGEMAVEHTYAYRGESSMSSAGLLLATSGGRYANPYFFRGFIERADQTARALLAVAEVSRTRYFDAGLPAKIRDPVVTSNQTVLRFEAFSACNGVYARFTRYPCARLRKWTM